ncbi:hypothetical protein BHE74_00014099 [Ensete ventricosum]|nr:hypothetical protein BHE74_00014099 [Ensete ventricosum]
MQRRPSTPLNTSLHAKPVTVQVLASLPTCSSFSSCAEHIVSLPPQLRLLRLFSHSPRPRNSSLSHCCSREELRTHTDTRAPMSNRLTKRRVRIQCCDNGYPPWHVLCVSARDPTAPFPPIHHPLFRHERDPMGAIVKHLSSVLKWTKPSPKTTHHDGDVVEFESGYFVETLVEGDKLGVVPHTIRVSPEGELFAVDATNNNIVRITPPLSQYSRARLVAGSFQGYSGHVDGKPSDARFYHPKAVTMDDKGNVYVADTSNLAIRKIGEAGASLGQHPALDLTVTGLRVLLLQLVNQNACVYLRLSSAGVTTIAGGKSNIAGYRDGPSEDAKFSTDFDVVYVGRTCSLLVVDRGNAALRQISLQQEDCEYQYSSVSTSG